MWGRRFDLVITLLLVIALATTAAVGLLADYLGIPRSLYHRLTAYPLAVLALVHIWRRRRQLWRLLKSVIVRRRRTISPGSDPVPVAEATDVPASSRRVFLLSGLTGALGFVLGRGFRWDKAPAEFDAGDIGRLYHDWSKPSWGGLFKRPFQWGAQPPLYKDYASAARVSLPRNFDYRGLHVEEAIQRRRSIRDYSKDPLTLEQLSLLLHLAYGITEPSYPLRASPSAGAQYPLEIYPVAGSVSDLGAGIYHYRPLEHALDLIQDGDVRPALLVAAGGQDLVFRAAVTLVITAVFQRTRWRYQERAYRYIMLEAGHVGQNVYLAATSLGLASCAIGAFLDEEINKLIGVDGEEEAVVYLLSIGTRNSE